MRFGINAIIRFTDERQVSGVTLNPRIDYRVQRIWIIPGEEFFEELVYLETQLENSFLASFTSKGCLDCVLTRPSGSIIKMELSSDDSFYSDGMVVLLDQSLEESIAVVDCGFVVPSQPGDNIRLTNYDYPVVAFPNKVYRGDSLRIVAMLGKKEVLPVVAGGYHSVFPALSWSALVIDSSNRPVFSLQDKADLSLSVWIPLSSSIRFTDKQEKKVHFKITNEQISSSRLRRCFQIRKGATSIFATNPIGKG